MRRSVKPTVDKQIFRNTAVSGKKVNLGTILYRGGYRF